jgi:hypothetical protein
VLTLKLALVCPADTVTLDGTVATDVLLLDSVTVAPPEGAAPDSVTVPVELFRPLTLVGFSVREERVTLPLAGLMVRDACCELLPSVALITAIVVLVTEVVVTVKFADVEPDGTVTLPGTLADELLLLKLTTEPPEGAAELNVTVPVELFPPTTLVGFNVTEEMVGPLLAGLMVSEACCELLPSVAVIVAVVAEVTVWVLTVNVALVAPAGTMTLAGTVAAAALLESATVAPPGGAPLSVTVPCELPPPVTLGGLRVSDATVMTVGAVTYRVLVMH